MVRVDPPDLSPGRELNSHIHRLLRTPSWTELLPEVCADDLFRKHVADCLRQNKKIDCDFNGGPWRDHLHKALYISNRVVRGVNRDEQEELAMPSQFLSAEASRKRFEIEAFNFGGSLNKGTAVCPSSADVDIVFYFKDFDPARYAEYIDEMERALRLVPSNWNFQKDMVIEERGFYFEDLGRLRTGRLSCGGGAGVDGKTGYLEGATQHDVAQKARYLHVRFSMSDTTLDLLAGGRNFEVTTEEDGGELGLQMRSRSLATESVDGGIASSASLGSAVKMAGATVRAGCRVVVDAIAECVVRTTNGGVEQASTAQDLRDQLQQEQHVEPAQSNSTNTGGFGADWPFWSASLIPIHNHVIGAQPSVVREAIRAAKWFRDHLTSQLNARELPSSFLIEMLVLHVYHELERKRHDAQFVKTLVRKQLESVLESVKVENTVIALLWKSLKASGNGWIVDQMPPSFILLMLELHSDLEKREKDDVVADGGSPSKNGSAKRTSGRMKRKKGARENNSGTYARPVSAEAVSSRGTGSNSELHSDVTARELFLGFLELLSSGISSPRPLWVNIWGKSRESVLPRVLPEGYQPSDASAAWVCDPFFEQNNVAVKVKNWTPFEDAAREALSFAYCPTPPRDSCVGARADHTPLTEEDISRASSRKKSTSKGYLEDNKAAQELMEERESDPQTPMEVVSVLRRVQAGLRKCAKLFPPLAHFNTPLVEHPCKSFRGQQSGRESSKKRTGAGPNRMSVPGPSPAPIAHPHAHGPVIAKPTGVPRDEAAYALKQLVLLRKEFDKAQNALLVDKVVRPLSMSVVLSSPEHGEEQLSRLATGHDLFRECTLLRSRLEEADTVFRRATESLHLSPKELKCLDLEVDLEAVQRSRAERKRARTQEYLKELGELRQVEWYCRRAKTYPMRGNGSDGRQGCHLFRKVRQEDSGQNKNDFPLAFPEVLNYYRPGNRCRAVPTRVLSAYRSGVWNYGSGDERWQLGSLSTFCHSCGRHHAGRQGPYERAVVAAGIDAQEYLLCSGFPFLEQNRERAARRFLSARGDDLDLRVRDKQAFEIPDSLTHIVFCDGANSSFGIAESGTGSGSSRVCRSSDTVRVALRVFVPSANYPPNKIRLDVAAAARNLSGISVHEGIGFAPRGNQGHDGKDSLGFMMGFIRTGAFDKDPKKARFFEGVDRVSEGFEELGGEKCSKSRQRRTGTKTHKVPVVEQDCSGYGGLGLGEDRRNGVGSEEVEAGRGSSVMRRFSDNFRRLAFWEELPEDRFTSEDLRRIQNGSFTVLCETLHHLHAALPALRELCAELRPSEAPWALALRVVQPTLADMERFGDSYTCNNIPPDPWGEPSKWRMGSDSRKSVQNGNCGPRAKPAIYFHFDSFDGCAEWMRGVGMRDPEGARSRSQGRGVSAKQAAKRPFPDLGSAAGERRTHNHVVETCDLISLDAADHDQLSVPAGFDAFSYSEAQTFNRELKSEIREIRARLPRAVVRALTKPRRQEARGALRKFLDVDLLWEILSNVFKDGRSIGDLNFDFDFLNDAEGTSGTGDDESRW